MLVSWLVIILYLSFLIDLVIFPVASEASFRNLLKSTKISVLKQWLFTGMSIVSLLFYLAPLAFALMDVFGKMRFFDHTDYSITGVVFGYLGRFISLAGTSTLRKRRESEVVSRLVFKVSRNPITLGMHITVFGLLIALGISVLWIFFIIYLINFHLKILHEEQYLTKKFGAEYVEYKQQTPRYLGL